jgi:hypothetical protein
LSEVDPGYNLLAYVITPLGARTNSEYS